MPYILVRRTDDLALIYELLNPVCRPACDTGNRKDRSKHLRRNAEHRIYKSAVKVDIAADRLMQVLAAGQELGRQLFYLRIEHELFCESLFLRQAARVLLQNDGTRIVQCVDGVSHSIDQPALVKRLFVDDFFQICVNLVIIFPVLYMLLDIGEHVLDLQVCTAVPGSFQRTERSGYR